MRLPFTILASVIDPALVDAALRTINLDLFTHGLGKREIEWWNGAPNWFPHLREHPTVLALRDAIPPEFRGEPCEPQILLGFPEEAVPDSLIYPHVDKVPPWAEGREYASICQVPLTPADDLNGGVMIWEGERRTQPRIYPGDVLVMRPDTPHSRGINRSGQIRYAIYFRFLK